MRVERFKAATMREALNAVKEKLGENAVILNSKTNPDGVEIIAALDEPHKDNLLWKNVLPFQEKPENFSSGGYLNMTLPADDQENAAQSSGFKTYDFKGNVPKEKLDNRVINRQTKQGMKDHKEAKGEESTDRLSHSEKTAEQTKEFAETMRREMQIIDRQKELWLESEKKLNELKQEIAELRESLLKQELAALKEKANLMQLKERPQKRSKKQDQLSKKYYQQISSHLNRNGVADEMIHKILHKVDDKVDKLNIDLSSETGIRRLKECLADEIVSLIPVSKLEHKAGQTRIIAVVGPSHSGKTTTCMKLAVKSSVMQKKKVALILISTSTDTTSKHLSLLAKAAQLPLAIVTTPVELEKTIAGHEDKDMIVIDFALSDKENSDISAINKYLNIIPSVETHLVIPMNDDKNKIVNIAQHYLSVDYHHIISTMIDKMENLGGMLELFQNIKKPLSYICNGEMIPDHIEPAYAAKSTRMILKG